MNDGIISDRFQDKVAFVTGAGSGIGRAIASRLVAEGARVAGVDINADALANVAELLGPNFVPLAADVTDEREVAETVKTTVSELGGMDLAFHVAGAARNNRIVDLQEDDWNFTIDLVQKAVFLCTKHVARVMREHAWPGSIVNVASVNSRMPMIGGSAYATGKAGVEMFTRNAALELAEDAIRVNAVLPGLVDTPLVSSVLRDESLVRAYLERIPLGFPATPELIAGPCLYLASEDAAYITGAALTVDGGWTTTGYPNFRRQSE